MRFPGASNQLLASFLIGERADAVNNPRSLQFSGQHCRNAALGTLIAADYGGRY
jgi:hypothetical protein